MKVLFQRVSHAKVEVDHEVTGAIDEGLLLLVGVCDGDTEAEVRELANKVVHMRIFNDEAGKFDRSLLDVGGSALVVSQFTLYADTRRGRRPAFTEAARPEKARPLVDLFARILSELGVARVESGVFGADMNVSLLNQGPVTIALDTDEMKRS